MSYEPNEIDDIFKKGLANNASTYKKEYWNIMEEMLDEKRPSIYGFAYKKWLSYVGLTSLILVMMVIGNGTNKSTNMSAKSNNVQTPIIYPVVNYNNAIMNESLENINSHKNIINNSKKVTYSNTKTANTIDNNLENLIINKNNLLAKSEVANNEITSEFEVNRIKNYTLNNKKFQNIITQNNDGISSVFDIEINNSTFKNPIEITTDNISPKIKDEKLSPTKKSKINKNNKAEKTEVISVANLDLHILGGLTYGNSFNTNQAKNNNNAGYMLGLGFGYYFNKNLSLSIDLMYQKRNGHELERNVTSEEFFLYKKSSTYTLKTEGTDYLVLPLQMRYQVKKHHALSLGIYTNFLLNSYNTIYTTVSANNTKNIETSRDKVNYGCWETVNYGYTISYEYNPTKKIGIGVGYYKGMKDATINSFYRNEKKDLMSDFTINLKYYLK